MRSFLGSLHGFESCHNYTSEGANPMGRYSSTPFLLSPVLAAGEHLLVSLVSLTKQPIKPAEELSGIRIVFHSTNLVTIECADGDEFLVQLSTLAPLDFTFAGRKIQGSVRFAHSSSRQGLALWLQHHPRGRLEQR